jgi:DHA1 family bicyclomycin/chloramphenicol resistance-like MFS transporter
MAHRRARAALTDRVAVALVGCFLMLQPMSTDFYLASLPGLAQRFAASVATVQLTLSVFILAFGTMQLVVGPLSDRVGRFPVVIAGLALYAFASLACALAPSIEFLIAARFLQAVGCCAAVVIARAIISDVFDTLAGAKVMAQASTLLAIGPLVGPVLGSYLEVRYGFRAIFAVVTTFAFGLLAVTALRLPETNPHRDAAAVRPRALARNYAHVSRSARFQSYALVGAASYSGLFAFISGSSFVLIGVLGVATAHFGYAFAFCVLGYMLGTIACRRLLAARGLVRTLKFGACLSAGGGLAMGGLALAGVHHWAAIVLPQFMFMFAHGINFPCAQSGAVTAFPRQAGAAAGLLGFVTMLLAALVGWWIGASNNGTVYPLAATVAAFGVLTFAAVWGWVAKVSEAGVRG